MNETPVTRTGSCHCGAVRLRVKLPDPVRVARCNCSICAVKGAVTFGVPLADLEVTEGADALTLYQFGTRTAKHWFCSHCGSYTHHQRRSDPSTYGVNVACIDGMSPFDFKRVPVVDGIHHARDNDGRVRVAGDLRYEPRER
jgi:hypothetical protein